jgi:hypothetical protein
MTKDSFFLDALAVLKMEINRNSGLDFKLHIHEMKN